jgi:hypothetical protein
MYKPAKHVSLDIRTFRDREVVIAVNAVAAARGWDVDDTARILLLHGCNEISKTEDVHYLEPEEILIGCAHV